MRARLVVIAGVTASAVAVGLYARVEWPWLILGWVGLVPWLAVLDGAASAPAALGAGWLMTVGFGLGVFGWFASAIATYTGVPAGLALLVLVLAAPLLQPQLITFALARHLARRRTPGFWRPVLLGAAVYVGTEWALPKLFFDTLGHGLYASVWMRQAADLGGASLLTFVLLVGNECVLRIVRPEKAGAACRRALVPAACLAALVVGLLAYGAARCRQLGQSDGGAGRITAGLVQADIDRYDRLRAERGTFEAVRAILDTHFALSEEAMRRAPLDVLIWPETVYPTTFGSPKSEAGAAFDREIATRVARTGVPLVFGAYAADGADEFNAAVFLEPSRDGRLAFTTYRKAALFPLTERVPASLESARLRRWLPWLGTWKPGEGPEVIVLGLPGGRSLRVAPLICYDAVDPARALAAVRRGAELILTLSNDSWFAAGNGPRLHLVVSAFRSLETRRPQLRATNTGISAVIDRTGQIVATAGTHVRATLVAAVAPERSATSLMLAWGDWFGPTALGTAALLAATLLGKPNR